MFCYYYYVKSNNQFIISSIFFVGFQKVVGYFMINNTLCQYSKCIELDSTQLESKKLDFNNLLLADDALINANNIIIVKVMCMWFNKLLLLHTETAGQIILKFGLRNAWLIGKNMGYFFKTLLGDKIRDKRAVFSWKCKNYFMSKITKVFR